MKTFNVDKNTLAIIDNFQIEGCVKEISPYGEGHINVSTS